MTPQQYAALTLDELALTLEGHQFKLELQLNPFRVLGSWLYGVNGKRKKPAELIKLPILDKMSKQSTAQSRLTVEQLLKKLPNHGR